MLSNDYYDYKELKEKAYAPDATAQDRINLFKWFDHNNSDAYNGECYPLENGDRLYPVWQGVDEPDEDGDYDQYELIDAEIR